MNNSLKNIETFSSTISNIPWFTKIGEKIKDNHKIFISNYIKFFNKNINTYNVGTWKEAISLLNSEKWNKGLWEKEEKEKINLYNFTFNKYPQENLFKKLNKVTKESSKILENCNFKGLNNNDLNYEYYSKVAAGSAALACYQMALAIAANKNDQHIFVSKFELFRLGYWPLIITDNTFNIF